VRGILIRSPSRRGVAEEAPGTYKDVFAVFDAAEAAGLAKKAARLEPLVCIKGWTPLSGRIGRAVSLSAPDSLNARWEGTIMNLEKYWYEAAPFVYTVVAGIFLGRADSVLSVISSVLLLSAGATITFLRRTHSPKMRPLKKTPR